MRNLIKINPIGNNFALYLGRSKEGIVVRIDHTKTVVDPEELKNKAEMLAADMKLERITK